MRHWLSAAARHFTTVLLVSLIVGLSLPTAAFAVNAFHPVTFLENDSPSDPVSTFQTLNSPANLTPFSSLSPAFSNTGYVFEDWNTAENGGGTSYANGALYSFASDLTLYAQWTSAFHPVTFFENDSPSDPVSTFQTLNSPANLTPFSSLSPAFSNTGYVFEDWNTAENGGGTSYANGALYSFASDLTLYAQWTVNSGLVTFSSNGGTGSISSLSGAVGSSVTLPGGSSLSYANNIFNDWNTTASGSGTSYSSGASFVLSSAPTLYAQWTSNGTTPSPSGSNYVITPNDGSGVGSLSPISLPAGASVQLPSSAGLSKLGYTFSGWYTAATGGIFLGLGGASFVPTSSVQIFAQWTANPVVTVRFSSNHGAGSIVAVNGLEGSTVVLPAASKLTYAGYTFAGWNTFSDAGGTSYANGAKIILSDSMTLYAQWSARQLGKGQSLLIGAIGPFASGSTQLSNTLKDQVRKIALAMKSKGYVSASLYGYATGSGSPALNLTLSAKRAIAVVFYLRQQLAEVHTKSVTMRSAGEGAIKGSTIAMFRRVEIFVK
jgi:uncharacterized repeat protein (TIGR02543 family)